MWPIFAGAVLIHIGYKVLQAMAYSRGAYTVVYPVVRGTGPLFAVIGAWLLFGERFTPTQWLGVAVLLSGIYGLAIYNLRFYPLQRDTLRMALGLAVATGLFVALYTTYDAYGIRASADPFTFLAWFFMFDGLSILPRETSTVFAALIGWLVLRETVGPRRIALMGLIAAGAVIVEFGG